VMKALEKDPDKRLTARELRQEFLSASGIEPEMLSLKERTERDLLQSGEGDVAFVNTIGAERETRLIVECRRHIAEVLNSLLEGEPEKLAVLLNRKQSFEKRVKKGYNPTPEQWRKIESIF